MIQKCYGMHAYHKRLHVYVVDILNALKNHLAVSYHGLKEMEANPYRNN